MTSLKVAIDSGPLSDGHSVRGIGVMVREQIEAIRRLRYKDIKFDSFNFQSEDGIQKLEANHYDIVHYTYFFPYSLTLPPNKIGKKTVVTIQDLIHLIYPDKYPPGIRGKLNFYKQKRRLKYIDAVITISETSKKDIVRFLGIPSDKVHVVYLAPQKGMIELNDVKLLKRLRKKYNLPEKFILYVGDVNYNKNIPGLIEACKIAKTPLVIIGKHAMEIEELGVDLRHLKGPRDWIRFLFNIPHPELAHFKGLMEEFKKTKNIIRLGYVADKDFVAVFNLASVYVQPSFYEGFGLPVLEAFACGVPVVISKTNTLVEIAGGAALIADPNEPKNIAEKITEVLENKRTEENLIQKGFERVKDFSWEKTAKESINVYRSVVSSK